MHHALRPVAVAVLASVLVTAVLSVPAGVSAGSDGVAQSTTTSSTSTTSTTTSTTQPCDAAEGDLVPLCQAYHHITDDYVGTVKARDLAERAAAYVRGAGLAARTDGMPPACHRPTEDFAQVCTEIDAVDDTAAAVWKAIAGMVAVLNDSQSRLWTTKEYEQFTAWLENTQTGIGIGLALMAGDVACEVVSSTCRPVIIDVYPGSPAETGGLMEGDVLVELDGPLSSSLSCSHIPGLDNFTGDQDVIVKVLRGGQTISATLRPIELDVPVVRGRVVLGNVGYLRIDTFSSTVDTDTASELASLTSSGIGGLVLDLRDNPGGYLDETVNATGLFLPDPSVVAYTARNSGEQTHTATGQTTAANGNALPMVVALDRGSASASEVMSGALKDHGRAIPVGMRTFGKNTGQNVFDLENGAGEKVGVLRLTTLRWTTPDRRSAAGGFPPDVPMTLPLCLHPAEVARRAIVPLQAKVSQVAITSLPVNGAYTPGQTVQVTVTFDPTVAVDVSGGTPAITLDVGGGGREAAYTSGSDTADGTTELVFEYTIAAGDSDRDGIHIDADTLTTGGGTIRRSSGLDALLAHDRVAADRRHAVTGPPTEVRLSVEPSSVDENSGPTEVTVTAAFPAGAGTRPEDVVVPVSIPENPEKYDSTSVDVFIPAGDIEASSYFWITPADDSRQERNRRVEVGGTAPDLPGLTVRAATLTIRDDEGEPPPPPPRRPAPRPGPSGGGGGGGGGSSGGGGGGGGGGAPPPQPPPPPAVEPVPAFSDTGGSVHSAGIETIAAAGITRGCNPPANDRYCPDRDVTRAQMATFLARALKLPESQGDSFGDDDGTTHEDNINRLADAGITQGCNPPANDRYCPDQVVTRAQMATFLARALALKGGPTGFTDISANPHRAGIEGIAAAGITRGCNPPANDRYCPDRDVTRAQMATFLARLLTLIAPV